MELWRCRRRDTDRGADICRCRTTSETETNMSFVFPWEVNKKKSQSEYLALAVDRIFSSILIVDNSEHLELEVHLP